MTVLGNALEGQLGRKYWSMAPHSLTLYFLHGGNNPRLVHLLLFSSKGIVSVLATGQTLRWNVFCYIFTKRKQCLFTFT